VGTAKRERQKANRQQRLEELAKEARKQKSKKVGVRLGGAIVAFVALVGALYIFSGDDSSSSTASTTTVAVSTTTGVTVPTPPKPVVKFPGTAPTELVVTDLKEGTGEAAKTGDSITLHYVGVLSTDGTEFDNSYDRGEPFTFTIGSGQVIEGWDQGMVGVKAGGQRQLDIPAALAYGDQDRGDIIKAGSALTFVVDIVSITPAAG
jgi:peptidylprolyl isomerase